MYIASFYTYLFALLQNAIVPNHLLSISLEAPFSYYSSEEEGVTEWLVIMAELELLAANLQTLSQLFQLNWVHLPGPRESSESCQ